MKDLVNASDFRQIAQHAILEDGAVWDVLSKLIRSENIDLLVLGTHGRGGLKKLTLGSVAEEVLRLAPCPVLTIGPKAAPAPSHTGDFSLIRAGPKTNAEQAGSSPRILRQLHS